MRLKLRGEPIELAHLSQDNQDYLLDVLRIIIAPLMRTHNDTALPPISIIIPTFNEEDYIGPCIESLVTGSYPSQLIEVILVDGGSTDKTIERAVTSDCARASVVSLANPKKIVPSAMNIGIQNAAHEVVIWAGAHATYNYDYLRALVETLLEQKWSSVGGVLEPIGQTFTGKAIALATTSKFGIGNASYRFAKRKQQVDTVFGGCWLKSTILKIGGFDEAWVRNQDYELNCRLRSEVGPIVVNPVARCSYHCRNSFSSLAVQYFNYGYWRFHTLLRHKASFSFRIAAPLLLLAGLLTSLILSFFGSPLALVIPSLYFTGVFIATLTIAARTLSLPAILLPIIFSILHLSWATGFLVSAVKHGSKHAHPSSLGVD